VLAGLSPHIHVTENEEWVEKEIGSCIIKISNLGRIKYPNGRITKGSVKLTGYASVRIDNRNVYVHRLVCEAFTANLPNDFQNLEVRT
jgi:hypothetical protein